MTVQPEQFARRSFVYRRLTAAGARFTELDGAAVAKCYAAEGNAARLGLADLSPLDRAGIKGRGTFAWLGEGGLPAPEANNRAARHEAGGLVARLADNEALLLRGLDGDADWISGLDLPQGRDAYPAPRRDSHAWFLVTGTDAAACLAKLCGVDLRAHKFADLAVAQTSLATISAIIIRDDRGRAPAYHLLADSASSPYLWDCLIDAMAEFDGGPVGLRALRALG